METRRLNIGLSPDKPFGGDTIAVIFDLLTNSNTPSNICQESLPKLFKNPLLALRFADCFGQACLMEYLTECRAWGEPIKNDHVESLSEAVKAGFEISISIFSLARKFEKEAYKEKLRPVALASNSPDTIPTSSTEVTANNNDFNNILSSTRMTFGSREPYKDSKREGLIVGSNAGIILLAQRHSVLTADFELADREVVEDSLEQLLPTR